MLENKNNNKLNWNKGELGERNKMGWLWKTANQQVAGADILLFFCFHRYQCFITLFFNWAQIYLETFNTPLVHGF